MEVNKPGVAAELRVAVDMFTPEKIVLMNEVDNFYRKSDSFVLINCFLIELVKKIILC